MNAIEAKLDYKVLQLSNGRLADLERLHHAVYGIVPPAGFFAGKYDTFFTGVAYTGFLAYNAESLPVAFYGVIPCFLQVNGKTVLSAQSADTMTHPDYRYKGLFVELAGRTFELCRTLGIGLIFGFPNQNSLPGFINKLGWQMTERMDCFRIPVRVAAWQRVVKKTPFLKEIFDKIRLKELRNRQAGIDRLPNSIRHDGFAGIHRDRNFRKYKTYNETWLIKIDGAELWIKTRRELLIGDMTITAGIFDTVMLDLERIAAKLGFNEIQFHSSAGTALHRLFAAKYEAIPSFPVIFKDLGLGLPLEQIKFTSADIDTF